MSYWLDFFTGCVVYSLGLLVIFLIFTAMGA
jgi:hypothetical protein